ncbi:MAG: hypothetical protein V3V99_06175 [candidate division Zixibacteria bacterium]
MAHPKKCKVFGWLSQNAIASNSLISPYDNPRVVATQISLYLCRRALVVQGAGFAAGTAGDADGAAVVD